MGMTFLLMIIQAIVISNTYGQGTNDSQCDPKQIEQEFCLLCREVQVGLLSAENAANILLRDLDRKNENIIGTKGMSDMVLDWWESSLIYKEGPFWQKTYANGKTYGEEFLMRIPPEDRNFLLFRICPSEPLSPPHEIEIATEPNLPLCGEKLLKYGEWRYYGYRPQWRQIAFTLSFIGISGLTYHLHTRKESIEKQEWAWTDCAANPYSLEEEISLDKWKPEYTPKWYTEPTIKRPKWSTATRDGIIAIVPITPHALWEWKVWKVLRKDKIFPQER